MKSRIILVWLCILYFSAHSQTWSEPVTIFSGGNNETPDFTIDKNGNIHSVCAHKIQTNYWKIFYSKSNDNGLTWSATEDISLNNNLWMYNPKIVADSNNILYVSYDYNTGDPNNTIILIKKYDGVQWSNPDTVSTGLPGSMHSRLAIDNNNKLYCFWYNGISGGKIFYRTLENGIWSVITQPYTGNNEHFFLNNIVVDNMNNLHCVGAHHYAGQNGYDDRAIYFNFINGIWSNFTELSNNTTWEGLDIALDASDLPSITWGQYTSDSIPPNQGTFVASFNGSSWSTPQLLVEDHPEEQAIAIDQYNKKYVIDIEKTPTGYQQVSYTNSMNIWFGEIIQQNNYGCYYHKIILRDNKLHLQYSKVDTIIWQNGYLVFTSIQISNYNITTEISDYYNSNLHLSILPNPFSNLTLINFEITSLANVQVKILNLKGQLVNILVNENKAPGKYSINWEGNDLNGKKVSPGLYLVRLQVGRHMVTRSVILVQ
ncbi:MAG TPA: FlgD immunoglobulin-like domain containing protein [Bacteroidales bacterium]|nr:FlgD immunoglobulin-like domain containing protein [Bacteroidales bacterium]HQP53444.1 FlgD immunoglobulin-like domain containing protein [Bacteroidales bacterium]